MPKRWRFDGPGVWHHAMNRGLARRSVFEDRECVRYFLSCVARVVRRGLLEVHAYCVMTTHFHLLVRSPNGELSRGLQLIQNRYVRWFNRRSRRDGPLFRGRFLSQPVEGWEYRRAVLRYIDSNPVEARMVESPELYPHGSARHYARPRGPIWLERSWVERDARSRAGSPAITSRSNGGPTEEALRGVGGELVEARLHSKARGPDPLDELVAAAPKAVGRWMRNKAELADGTRPGIPCASATAVLRAWERRVERRPSWHLRRHRSQLDVWPVVLVGLLRDLAGLSWAEIQRRTGIPASGIQRRYAAHRTWMGQGGVYEAAVGELGRECVHWPAGGRSAASVRLSAP